MLTTRKSNEITGIKKLVVAFFIIIEVTLFALLPMAATEVKASQPTPIQAVINVHTNTVTIYWKGKRTSSYRFSQRPVVKFIKSKNLSIEQLENRKGNTLFIEICDGRQINESGDGCDINGKYIRYHGFHKGDKIRSFLIYNPYTNWYDDIIERFDILR